MSKFDFIFYNCMKLLVITVMRTLYNIKIVNHEVIPKNGGVLIVGNHSSWFDTLFLTCAMKRPLWFLTGEFILNVPVMGSIVKHLCTIPISKKRGMEGIVATINKLKQGEVVCVFPEGQLTSTGELQRFRNGISIIQKEANVKIIPFYIDGAFNTWSKKQKKPKFFKTITLKFGIPFLPVQSKDNEVANEIREKVLELV